MSAHAILLWFGYARSSRLKTGVDICRCTNKVDSLVKTMTTAERRGTLDVGRAQDPIKVASKVHYSLSEW